MSWLGFRTKSTPSSNANGLSASDIGFKVPELRQSAEENDNSSPESDEEQLEDQVPAFPAPNSAQRANGGTMLAAPSVNTAAKPSGAKRKKVALQPGFSQLDWFNLKNSGADMRVRP